MMHGFAFWFKIVFQSPRTSYAHVELLTGPSKGPTHWKQTVVFLDRPVKVKNDRLITGSVKLKQKKRGPQGFGYTSRGLLGKLFSASMHCSMKSRKVQMSFLCDEYVSRGVVTKGK